VQHEQIGLGILGVLGQQKIDAFEHDFDFEPPPLQEQEGLVARIEHGHYITAATSTGTLFTAPYS
jgi:hypothetical protein